ncbi:MAG: glycosyltransferase [Anaerolineaceae bacterium]|nr:glycosyltransferase [Anaerolineaceae bacterium]
MKSLHIIDHFSLGGAQRIVEGIVRSSPTASLLPLHKKGGNNRQIAIDDEDYLIKPGNNLFLQLWKLLQVPRLIRKNKIQIVHCHLQYSWLFGFWVFVSLPAHQRPKFIFHEHDSINLTRWYYPMFVKLVSRAGSLMAVSAFIQQHIISCGIAPEKVLLLKNYIDLERFSPGKRAEFQNLGLNEQQVNCSSLIGFAGRLVEYKGWRLILKAADNLRDKNVLFLIAGEGPDKSKLIHEIRQLGLQNKVVLLGYISHMVDFYRTISVLVITSEKEAFGLVQMEAQACGVPVVVFDSQAAQEIQGDHSTIIVPNGDVEQLADKIKELLDDRALYESMVEKGLANARKYSLTVYIEQLNQIYLNLS